MFGGAGIFEAGVMFAMVDSKGAVALRADKDTSVVLESAGGHNHGRMPYWTISDDVAGDTDTLLEWAQTALAVARAAKKK
jgi:TfoX/Sxy family transcriptional regulator of competence genes